MLCLSFLWLVQVNTGPSQNTGSSQRSATQQRQLSLSQAASSPPLPPPQQKQGTKGRRQCDDSEVMQFLRELKVEMKSDLSSINNKIDMMSTSINNLRQENAELKAENKSVE